MGGWPWSRWLRATGRETPPGADVLITGLPRSGTSYLCTAIHNVRQCVAINEPEEIFAHLSDVQPPWGMPRYYARLRDDILAGRPIANKMRDGRLIEDTAREAGLERYVPTVRGAGFLLATKNTLAYLARLPLLARSMPDATCIACIRHPVDTVASWKDTFSHLSTVAVRDFSAGFLGDERLTAAGRERVAEIAATPRVETRRALLWRHLALLIEEAGSFIGTVVRYERLVTDPAGTVRGLLESVPNAPPFEPVEPFRPSRVRGERAAALGPDDRAAIHEVCADVARRFGYDAGAAEEGG